jgi:hypothetical protein
MEGAHADVVAAGRDVCAAQGQAVSDFEIVRQQSIKYDESGQTVVSEELYVKVAVSFRKRMREMKGARLSAFFALALNEAEISFGRSPGLSVYDIASGTPYGTRATLSALQFLCAHNFATQLERCGDHGEKLYRVSAYAWFGNSHNEGSAKSADRVGNCRGMQKATRIVVDKDSLDLDQKNLATTDNLASAKSDTRDDERRRDCLWDLDLRNDEAHAEILACEWATLEYLEDWVLHRHLTAKRQGRLFGEDWIDFKLKGGYYRLQIREQRQSPYQMSAAQRREYRERKDREWEQSVTEERMEPTR